MKKSFSTAAVEIRKRLTRPSRALTDIGDRRQAELLAGLSLFFALLNTLAVIFAAPNQNMVGIIVLVVLSITIWIAYGFSRSRHFQVGSLIIAGIWTLATFGYAFSGSTTNGPVFVFTIFIPLVFVIGLAILQTRWLVVVIIINLAGVLLAPLILPNIPQREFRTAAGVLICLGGLTLIAQYYRDQVERERQAQLQQALDAIKKLNDGLEQRVEERTVELRAANRELESFSYTISHDLRAPLRAINGYMSILNEGLTGKLQPEETELLERVKKAAKDMGLLIDGLLAFTRLNQQKLIKQRLDMEALVRDVWKNHNADNAGRAVHFECGDLPPCTADPVLMRQVVANLIDNSLKFTRQRNPAHIQVGVLAPHQFPPNSANLGGEPEGGQVFYVRDNGIGFDMAHINKLFGVFQRLHRVDEFEGLGIGLATVQRIIHRHGGKVWADSKPGEGATIYFTIGNQDQF